MMDMLMTVIIENVGEIIGYLITLAITALFAWIGSKIAKNQDLKNLDVAFQQVEKQTHVTVGELQQTLVGGLKNASADGKLTEDEIAMIGRELIAKTVEKLPSVTINLLNAAGSDLAELIHGYAENFIAKLKGDM